MRALDELSELCYESNESGDFRHENDNLEVKKCELHSVLRNHHWSRTSKLFGIEVVSHIDLDGQQLIILKHT